MVRSHRLGFERKAGALLLATTRISDDVYRDVLTQAVRMLYYQRDGIAKDAKYAGADYADGPAHMGASQDPTCTLYRGATHEDVHAYQAKYLRLLSEIRQVAT